MLIITYIQFVASDSEKGQAGLERRALAFGHLQFQKYADREIFYEFAGAGFKPARLREGTCKTKQ